MPNIAKSTFIVITIASLYTAAAAQSQDGRLALPAQGSQENVLNAEGDVARAEAKGDKAVARADREEAKVSDRKLMSSRALSRHSIEGESIPKADSAAPSNHTVDPCMINKNLPECRY